MFGEKRILIVEDEAMVALGLSMAVEDLEGTVIGPVATVAEGLSLIDTETIAAAVLDANLADRDVTPLAAALVEAGIPLVIYTGTGLPAELADLHPDMPVLMKPANPTAVAMRLFEEIQLKGR